MNSIDVFYQVEGVGDIQHVAADENESIGGLKSRLCKSHGLGEDAAVWLENEEEPLAETTCLGTLRGPSDLKIHIHRCRRVTVSVSFNGEKVERLFAPSATVGRVKHWAAVRGFGLSEEEAGEHVLQISGTQERPRPGTHLGTLVDCRRCRVAFDLVPDERINGAAESAG
jgi:hypothetical protein